MMARKINTSVVLFDYIVFNTASLKASDTISSFPVLGDNHMDLHAGGKRTV